MTEHSLGSEARPLTVAVVGSGPSAFYAVEALFKTDGLTCRCDVFDRLPTPFGLVRGGVAPDHQKIKAVVRVYEKVAADPRFRFFGNVTIGRDLTVEELQGLYDRVVWAVGNESDRKMGVPGEDLDGVHSATDFVGWYNGHPDHQDHDFRLADTRRVVVVGNGNVAMDVARILVSDRDQLSGTDIADAALAALRDAAVEEVVLLGRRGPAQAAFSPKEIAELAKVEGADLVVPAEEAALDPVSEAWLESSAPRAATRNATFLLEHAERGEGEGARRVRTVFRASPVEVLGADGQVTGVRVERNELRPDADGVPRPHGTGETFDLDCQIVLAAIGYRGVPLPGLPFCERRGIIPNRDGRVLREPAGEVLPGHYVVGWAKRGPSGLIGNNSPDSKDTVARLVEDLGAARAPSLRTDEAARTAAILGERGVDFVGYDDWVLLDAWEQDEGRRRGKVRHKLTRVLEILEVVRRLRGGG